jgi:hypothetical protein
VVEDRPADGRELRVAAARLDRPGDEVAAGAILQQHESPVDLREDPQQRLQGPFQDLAEVQGAAQDPADLQDGPQLLLGLDLQQARVVGRRDVPAAEEPRRVLVLLLDLDHLAVEGQHVVANLDLGAVAQADRPGQLPVIDPGAVAALEVLDGEAVAPPHDHGMLHRHVLVVQDDVAIGAAADARGLPTELEEPSGRPALDHPQGGPDAPLGRHDDRTSPRSSPAPPSGAPDGRAHGARSVPRGRGARRQR